jgi:hypothetical protein
MPALLKNSLILFTGIGLLACTPTVQMQAPDKPIEINMNVNIQHEVRVKVDKELESAFDENPELFGAE